MERMERSDSADELCVDAVVLLYQDLFFRRCWLDEWSQWHCTWRRGARRSEGGGHVVHDAEPTTYQPFGELRKEGHLSEGRSRDAGERHDLQLELFPRGW